MYYDSLFNYDYVWGKKLHGLQFYSQLSKSPLVKSATTVTHRQPQRLNVFLLGLPGDLWPLTVNFKYQLPSFFFVFFSVSITIPVLNIKEPSPFALMPYAHAHAYMYLLL